MTRLTRILELAAAIDHELNPNRDRVKHVEREYGLPEGDYLALISLQKGVCAICGKKEGRRKTMKPGHSYLNVDHCHVSGRVRGLLCTKCNTGLGMFTDRPELLRLAAAYLER